MQQKTAYVFLDESGNFDFSPSGTPHLILGCVVYRRGSPLYSEVSALRYDLMEEGRDLERFHATDDRQAVRDRVFEVICRHLADVHVHAVIVEKAKTDPALHTAPKFYPPMLGHLLRHVLTTIEEENVIVITDRIPVAKQRRAVERAVKTTLAEMIPSDGRYRVYHHDSRSNIGVQIADYCTWAIQRYWRNGDARSYDLIKPAIRSEILIP